MEINEFKEIMNENAKKINIEFNDKQLEQFFEYMNLLIEWNEKINLMLYYYFFWFCYSC